MAADSPVKDEAATHMEAEVAKRFLVANGFLNTLVEALGAEVAELRAAETAAGADLSQVRKTLKSRRPEKRPEKKSN